MIGLSLSICAILIGGWSLFSVITDPVLLWSPENSATRLNKQYFETHFAPFYRTTQLIIRPTDSSSWTHYAYDDQNFDNISKEYSSLLKIDFLRAALQLQNEISALKGNFTQNSSFSEEVGLKDICFQPLYPDNQECVIQSIFEYWQNSEERLMLNVTDFFTGSVTLDYISHFESCTQSPTNINDSLLLSCLGNFGGPISPYVVLGGYPSNDQAAEYGNATALVITYVINNNQDAEKNEKAMAWEQKVIDFMKNFSNPLMTVSYRTERSIQDELDRESKSDIKTIIISYFAMFLYITLTLGKYSFQFAGNLSLRQKFLMFWRKMFLQMKFTLGLAGVAIVMLSVFSSIGLFSYFGVKATLIIFEVIPFLVLAVGVDNIFILVQRYQRDIRLQNETLEMQIARIVSKVGPSMLLTSCSESLAFLLGALTPMPAVRIFSMYAALAVFVDFLLQITCFVSLMTLDCRRELANRLDLFFCLKYDEFSGKNGQPLKNNLYLQNESLPVVNFNFDERRVNFNIFFVIL